MQTSPKGNAQLCFAVVDDEPLMSQLVNDMLTSSNLNMDVFPLGAELLKSALVPKFTKFELPCALGLSV